MVHDVHIVNIVLMVHDVHIVNIVNFLILMVKDKKVLKKYQKVPERTRKKQKVTEGVYMYQKVQKK